MTYLNTSQYCILKSNDILTIRSIKVHFITLFTMVRRGNLFINNSSKSDDIIEQQEDVISFCVIHKNVFFKTRSSIFAFSCPKHHKYMQHGQKF